MSDFIRNLNQDQKKAVCHTSGPCLILAGPGTGKTTLLTRHLAYLIQKKSFNPDQILALTFSQKAAQEMRLRVENLFPDEYLDLPIYTFHAFAQHLLEEKSLDIGLPGRFKVLTNGDLKILIDKNWNRFKFRYYRPRGGNAFLISNLINHFSRCKDDGIGPEDYLKHFKDKNPDKEELARRQELAKAYSQYQGILLENGALDFGDLLYYAYQLLRERPGLLKEYQNKIKHLLIDEFQDTNKIQYNLAQLLSEPDKNIMVCASADQTIYQWRGAYYGNVERFLKDYPDAKKISLKKNYRSSQNLLDLSYHFIKQNEDVGRINQEKLKAIRLDQGMIKVWHFTDRFSEARMIIDEIKRLIKKKVNFSDIAILTRTNEQIKTFGQALEKEGVPVQSLIAGEVYRQSIVLDLLAYLTLRVNRYDDVAFYRYLNFSCWKLKNEDRDALIDYKNRKGCSLAEILKNKSALKIMPKESVATLERIIEWLDVKTNSLSLLILNFMEDSGYLSDWLPSASKIEADSLRWFLDRLDSFDQNYSALDLPYFLDQVEWDRIGGGENLSLEQVEAVKLMTIHSAKGLEFDYVFLPDLVDQVFPARYKKDSIPWFDQEERKNEQLSEERRLFFVAMTRARQGLYFSWSDDRGGVRKRKPSRFLVETGLDSSAEEKKSKQIRKIESERPKQSEKDNHLPESFSYTQLAAFQKCPWQYKLAHILKISTKGSPERSFGDTIHNTLAEFMMNRTSSQKPVGWDELQEAYKNNWIDDWYRDERQRRQFKKEGLDCLKKFYRRLEKENPLIYVKDGIPWIEKKLSGNVAGHKFKGKIDRVDQIEGGVELIDYKTGRTPARLSSENKEQLLIYQLAAENILKLTPVKLSFYYLTDDKILSFIGSSSDLKKIEDKINKIIENIKKGEFQATPGFHCRYCDFRLICAFRR